MESNEIKSQSLELIKDETLKSMRSRHRKRLGQHQKNKRLRNRKLKLFQNNELNNNKSHSSISIKSQCNILSIDYKPVNMVFMGVFHCNWMSNINANDNRSSLSIYLTKSYKGSSINICQNENDLKWNRCYQTIPLQFSYYGTGHTIYKNILFYQEYGSGMIITQRLDDESPFSKTTNQHPMPNDASYGNMNEGLYNIKHSGYVDFEVDENGLWLIYRKININKNEPNIYVIAKIDENGVEEMRIKHKWYVYIQRENVANMFISCGKLYALRSTMTSPATIYELCDLSSQQTTNSDNLSSTCSPVDVSKSRFDIEISSRQLTSLSYNPDKKQLYMVDGGSFVYYNVHSNIV
jgi:hypothetical protein